jgi:hypothetical protein
MVDINDRLRKLMRSFLRQIVPDAAGDVSVGIPAGELLPIKGWLRMRRTVGVTLKSDRGYRDDRALAQSIFKIVIA